MPIDQKNSCNNSVQKEKPFAQKAEEWFEDIIALPSTDAQEKLKEKRRKEQQKIQEETRAKCIIEYKKAEQIRVIDLGAISKKGYSRLDPKSPTGRMLGLNQRSIIQEHGAPNNDKDSELLETLKRQNKTHTPAYESLAERTSESIILSGTSEVNFRQSLGDMWQEKFRKYEQRAETKRIQSGFYRETVEPFIKNRSTEFHRESYEQYVSDIDRSIKESRECIGNRMIDGFAGYGIPRGSQAMRLALIMEKNIASRDLIGLSMTELFGNRSPINPSVLKTLIEAGGSEYLALIPSMNDEELSYGPYQHTSGSVNPKGGAKTADRIFSGRKILGDITIETLGTNIMLQHKAAYLLMLNNIALLIRKLIKLDFERENENTRIRQMRKVMIEERKHPPKLTKKPGNKNTQIRRIPIPLPVEKPILIEASLKALSESKKPTASGEFLNMYYGFLAGAHNSPTSTVNGMGEWIVRYVDSGGKETNAPSAFVQSPTAQANIKAQSDTKTSDITQLGNRNLADL